jgi:hypothetical protein
VLLNQGVYLGMLAYALEDTFDLLAKSSTEAGLPLVVPVLRRG